MFEELKNIGLKYKFSEDCTFVSDSSSAPFYLVCDIFNEEKTNKYIVHMKSKGLFTSFFRYPVKIHEELSIQWRPTIAEETIRYASLRLDKLKRILNEKV